MADNIDPTPDPMQDPSDIRITIEYEGDKSINAVLKALTARLLDILTEAHDMLIDRGTPEHVLPYLMQFCAGTSRYFFEETLEHLARRGIQPAACLVNDNQTQATFTPAPPGPSEESPLPSIKPKTREVM